MYAIVEIAGKQYKVRENDKLFVPHLADAKVDDTIEFDRVLLVADGDDVRVGTPLVTDASVSATVLEHVKADKILIFRKIRRKRFKVKKGHRQRYTQVEVGAVSLNGEKKKSATKKKSGEAATKSAAAETAEGGKAEAKKAEPKSTTKEVGKAEAKQTEPKSTAKEVGKAETKQTAAKSTTKEAEAKQADAKETATPSSKKGSTDKPKESAETAETKATDKSTEKDVRPEADAGPKPARAAGESANAGDADDDKTS